MIRYLIFLNLIAYLCMAADKSYSKQKNHPRISENLLIALAVLGGSFGIFVGMKTFRHKTKHALFAKGVPILLLIQLVLFITLRLLFPATVAALL